MHPELALAAASTDRMVVATGAMAAVQGASAGRVVLGIGRGDPARGYLRAKKLVGNRDSDQATQAHTRTKADLANSRARRLPGRS